MTRLERRAHTARRSIAASATALEERLWAAMRRSLGPGLPFERQVRIGPYLADFVSHPLRLIVEVDGSQHHRPADRRRDAARDDRLAALGYRVLRLPNAAVREDISGVLDTIGAVVEERRALPPGDEPKKPKVEGKRRARPT